MICLLDSSLYTLAITVLQNEYNLVHIICATYIEKRRNRKPNAMKYVRIHSSKDEFAVIKILV